MYIVGRRKGEKWYSVYINSEESKFKLNLEVAKVIDDIDKAQCIANVLNKENIKNNMKGVIL